MHSVRAVLSLVLAIGTTSMATSCASSRPADYSTRPERPSPRSRNLITREELTESAASDAYQAVQRLRPIWLHRTAASLGGPADVLIYVDGQRFGASAALSRISINSIKEIRFHSPSDATQRWGTDHSGGVIEVITR